MLYQLSYPGAFPLRSRERRFIGRLTAAVHPPDDDCAKTGFSRPNKG
jgi:hypothetical protein